MELYKMYKNDFFLSYLTLLGKRSWYKVRGEWGKKGEAIASGMRYPNFVAMEAEQQSQNLEREQIRSWEIWGREEC